MNIVRWNPAFDVLNMHSEIDRVFNDLVRGVGMAPSPESTNAFLPIDVYRKDGAVVVEASVPGFSPEEVDVTVDHDVLTISARREASEQADAVQYLRQERAVSGLFRRLALGEELDGERASAGFNNGVLTVTIPTIAKPEPRRIPVAVTTEAAK